MNDLFDLLFPRACRAYERRCKREESVYDYPSQYDSEIQGDCLVLANARGALGVYRILGDEEPFSLRWKVWG